ncbi:MAG: sensor histidine kinase [Bacteroidales bacterium]|nr:sensor histidine kinase [Bacteroidales bacterium]
MYIKIAIIISIVLQVFAAALAINLTRATRYNKSWILLTSALLLMAARRVIEYFPFIYKDISFEVQMINSWVGVVTSVIITAAIILIRKIFAMIKHAEASKLVMERTILNAIIRTEENERKRFAKDLHDGLGPLLSNVKMSISTLELDEKNQSNLELLSNMKLVINEAIDSIKEVSNNLSPHILENFGLESAIKSFIDKVKKTTDTEIYYSTNLEGKRQRYNNEIVLYRVICELMNNTLKHAEAKSIQLDVIEKNDEITIKYSDDGIGVDLDSLDSKTPGMGMSNMVSRIKSIQGKIEIKSSLNRGFSAYIKCPVKL